jgi:hypothetical protein
VTDYETFKTMVSKNGTYDSEGHPFLEPGWKAITFKVGAGIAGSKEGFVTAFFKPDGSFDEFMFCD